MRLMIIKVVPIRFQESKKTGGRASSGVFPVVFPFLSALQARASRMHSSRSSLANLLNIQPAPTPTSVVSESSLSPTSANSQPQSKTQNHRHQNSLPSSSPLSHNGHDPAPFRPSPNQRHRTSFDAHYRPEWTNLSLPQPIYTSSGTAYDHHLPHKKPQTCHSNFDYSADYHHPPPHRSDPREPVLDDQDHSEPLDPSNSDVNHRVISSRPLKNTSKHTKFIRSQNSHILANTTRICDQNVPRRTEQRKELSVNEKIATSEIWRPDRFNSTPIWQDTGGSTNANKNFKRAKQAYREPCLTQRNRALRLLMANSRDRDLKVDSTFSSSKNSSSKRIERSRNSDNA